jgi:hypothetical protein
VAKKSTVSILYLGVPYLSAILRRACGLRLSYSEDSKEGTIISMGTSFNRVWVGVSHGSSNGEGEDET